MHMEGRKGGKEGRERRRKVERKEKERMKVFLKTLLVAAKKLCICVLSQYKDNIDVHHKI